MRINHAAVIVAAVVYWLLGGLWFGFLFAKPWIALMGKSMAELEQASPGYSPYVVAIAGALIIAYVMAMMSTASNATTLGKGASLGLLLWVGFVGTTTLTNSRFSGSPFELWAINYGYALVGMVLVGAIVGAWQKKTA